MNAQLASVQRELQEATARVLRLVERLPYTAWTRRPDSGGWCVGQCIVHLNQSSEGFLTRLDEAIREGHERGLTATGPFRRDVRGWLLCKLVEPPYRIRVKTPARFDPQQVGSTEAVIDEWEKFQGELRQRIAAADGLALDKVRVISPFAPRIKYNLLSTFMVIPAHQRRHLWQADQILKSLL